MQPISQNNRTDIIDILRGWALFIVVTMNFAEFTNFNAPNDFKPSSFNTIFYIIEVTLLNTKGWLLLAILFGYGFAYLINKLEHNKKNIVQFFLWRMMWLFLIGIINSMIFDGDILLDYAVMGVLLLPFYKLKTKTLWWIIICGFLICPFIDPIFRQHPFSFSNKLYNHIHELQSNFTLVNIVFGNLLGRANTLIFSLPYSITVHIMQLIFFLLGLIAFRNNFFNQAKDRYYALIKKIFWISLVCFIALNILQILLFYILHKETIFKYISLRYITAVPGSLMFAAGLILLFVNNRCKKITDSMKYIGTMTLTNYMMQNIILFILFLLLKINMASYWNFLLAIFLYVIQIFFSKWWLSKYNYGFVEWLWRCLSYQQWFALKK